MVGADIFFQNKTFLCIVGHYSKFPIVKKEADSLAPDNLVKVAKITFTEFVLPMKFILDVDTNFTSDMLKQFYRHMNKQQAIA